jgi:hypothetical protein
MSKPDEDSLYEDSLYNDPETICVKYKPTKKFWKHVKILKFLHSEKYIVVQVEKKHIKHAFRDKNAGDYFDAKTFYVRIYPNLLADCASDQENNIYDKWEEEASQRTISNP